MVLLLNLPLNSRVSIIYYVNERYYRKFTSSILLHQYLGEGSLLSYQNSSLETFLCDMYINIL